MVTSSGQDIPVSPRRAPREQASRPGKAAGRERAGLPGRSVVVSLPVWSARGRMGHGRHPVHGRARAAARLADGARAHRARRRRRRRPAHARCGRTSGRHLLPALPGSDARGRRERGAERVRPRGLRRDRAAAPGRGIHPAGLPVRRPGGQRPLPLPRLPRLRAAAGARTPGRRPPGARGTPAAVGSCRRDRHHRTLRRRSLAHDRRPRRRSRATRPTSSRTSSAPATWARRAALGCRPSSRGSSMRPTSSASARRTSSLACS